MLLPEIISSVVARATARQARESTPGVSLPLLLLALAWGVAPGFASADPVQMMGTIVITDLTEAPVEAVVNGGTNGVNSTIRATVDNPEMLDFSNVNFVVDGKVVVDKDGKVVVGGFSFAVDGTVAGGTGMAVLLERNGKVSDILKVTVTPKKRGGGIDFFDVNLVFTSDSDPGGLDPGVTDEIMQKLLSTDPDEGGALQEDGTEQDIGKRLIDIATGKRLDIGGLVITAASDLPEPSTLLLLGPGLLLLAARRRRGKGSQSDAHILQLPRQSVQER
jgi:hypothetical protein